MQLDPIKPTLKAPESIPLKVRYDWLLSNHTFKFSLRHSNVVDSIATARFDAHTGADREVQRILMELLNQMDGFDQTAGAYTRPLLSSTSAVLVTPFGVPCLIDWGKIMRPTHPTQCAYVEQDSGRV